MSAAAQRADPGRWPWWSLALLAAACNGDHERTALTRAGPFGSLRDLVLFERPADAGGPFFLDRFEATRADWAEFAASPAGRAAGVAVERQIQQHGGAATGPHGRDATLPVAGVDLVQARAFARWRHCRLPRSDEWWYAVGGTRYPWGQNPQESRANTAELGVFEPLPVGTFESGRRGQGPYDLIGNVAEWTETVPALWFRSDRETLPAVDSARRRLVRTPALAVWHVPGSAPSAALLVEAAIPAAPREVLGADFASPMAEASSSGRPSLLRLLGPREWSTTVGVRLAASPAELLAAVAADWEAMDATARRQWRRFVARAGNGAVLAAAFEASGVDPALRERLLGGAP